MVYEMAKAQYNWRKRLKPPSWQVRLFSKEKKNSMSDTSPNQSPSISEPAGSEPKSSTESLDALPLEQRVARIEGKLGWRRNQFQLSTSIARISVVVSILALVFGLLGLGMPNHFYQVVLAILAVWLGYHREWFIAPREKVYWILAPLNAAVLSILFQLVIGSGKRFPFFWALYPTLEKTPRGQKEGWTDVVPDIALAWQTSALADWSIDLTIIQTFLLLITLIGALFDFQPFISLTAILLILVSIPALVGFAWPWVFPAMIAGGIAIYLQSSSFQEDQMVE